MTIELFPGAPVSQRTVVADAARSSEARTATAGIDSRAPRSLSPTVLAREPFVEMIVLPDTWSGVAMTASTRWRLTAPLPPGRPITLSTTVSARWYAAGREFITYTTTMTDSSSDKKIATADVTLFNYVDEQAVPNVVERRT